MTTLPGSITGAKCGGYQICGLDSCATGLMLGTLTTNGLLHSANSSRRCSARRTRRLRWTSGCAAAPPACVVSHVKSLPFSARSSRQRDLSLLYWMCSETVSAISAMKMIRSLLGLTVVCLQTLSARGASTQEEDARLQQVFTTYLNQDFELRPLKATSLGDHRFDAKLEDLSAEARRKWEGLTRKTLKELPKEVNYKRLSRAGQIDFETFEHDLRTDLWLTEKTHPYEQDPRTYNGYISDS